MNYKIPKKLHFCWFGKAPYDDTAKRCMESWKKFAPDFEIYEWNEKTYDLKTAPQYVQDALKAKKWAFVSDYVRLDVINNLGGIYLDTDMELVRDISPLLVNSAFMGFEDGQHINNAIMGSIPHHPFVKDAIAWYKENHSRTPTPIVMTSLFKSKIFPKKLIEEEQEIDDVHIYPHIAFYPYDKNTIKNFSYKDLTEKTYAVHFWNYSWGHPLNKFFKKTGMYDFGKKITEFLGIKKILKNVLHFE